MVLWAQRYEIFLYYKQKSSKNSQEVIESFIVHMVFHLTFAPETNKNDKI